MSNTFTVRVPATSANIGPGFDCLGVALDLYLSIDCSPAASFSMELQGEGSERLAKDGRNLLARCVATGRHAAEPSQSPDSPGSRGRKANAPPPSVRLVVRNQIPLARGLGSSSAAIVGGLAVGIILAKRERGDSDLLGSDERDLLVREATRIEGHPDNVAPAALGDLVISGVEKDAVITIVQHWPEGLEFVAVIPELSVRTDAARRTLPAHIRFADAVANGARLARLLGSLQSERFEHLQSALQDRLHQPYRLPLAPGLPEVLAILEREPHSLGAYLSGSGPTIMVLCTTGADSLGEAGVRAFSDCGVPARYRILHVDRRGVSLQTT